MTKLVRRRKGGDGTINVRFYFTKRAVFDAAVHTCKGKTNMPRIGFAELMIILAIVVIIFGANRLPQLGRGLGSAIRNFKEGLKDEPNHK
jgi:TatA/E family protein of Tat protein translocase